MPEPNMKTVTSSCIPFHNLVITRCYSSWDWQLPVKIDRIPLDTHAPDFERCALISLFRSWHSISVSGEAGSIRNSPPSERSQVRPLPNHFLSMGSHLPLLYAKKFFSLSHVRSSNLFSTTSDLPSVRIGRRSSRATLSCWSVPISF